jgi:group I intron endonuclease
MFIYCIHCLSTGKKYIGSSSDFDRRIYHHFLPYYFEECNTPLKKDIIKYKPEMFVYGIIEEVTEEERFEKEKYYMSKYNTIEDGYNMRIPIKSKGEYYLKHQEKIREYQREYQKKYRQKKSRKEYMKEYYRKRKLKN